MTNHLKQTLAEHACLYASFDQSADADFSRGDGSVRLNADVARQDASAGRFGGALVFSAKDHGWAEDECLFPAQGNFPYRETSCDGTIAFWLSGDPDRELNDEFPVDPFHISRHAADASFYLDLTMPNDWRYGSPRKLRFGFYNDSPEQNMFVGGQLIVAGELGWNDGNWHHVVATWKNANSGNNDGSAALYVDGQLRGTMQGYAHRLTWNIDEMHIGLGQRYVGRIDEFLILDAALTARNIVELHELKTPVNAILD